MKAHRAWTRSDRVQGDTSAPGVYDRWADDQCVCEREEDRERVGAHACCRAATRGCSVPEPTGEGTFGTSTYRGEGTYTDVHVILSDSVG